jgi:hypothetical protein
MGGDTTMNAPLKRQHLKLLDAAEAIRLAPDKTEAAFMARQLVQATLPHKNPGDLPAWVPHQWQFDSYDSARLEQQEKLFYRLSLRHYSAPTTVLDDNGGA